MTFLPIVERELRVAARLKATYRNRALTAALLAAVAVLMMLAGSLSRSPSFMGRAMFSALSRIILIFCLFEGVRKTADCLSEEKREGTLGLLFLTDLKGYDVALGKLAAMSLNSFYGLLAVLPLLALALLLGGVTPGEYWRTVLALISILLFSLSAGMLVSAVCRGERQARGGTVLLTGAIMAVPLLAGQAWFYPASPLYAFHAAKAEVYSFESGAFWRALEITQVITWLMLIACALILPRAWQDRVMAGRLLPRSRRGRAAVLRRDQTVFEQNPAFWLASRNLGSRRLHWLFSAVVGLAAAWAIFSAGGFAYGGIVYLVFLINFILKMRVATQASRCLGEARRNHTLEMMLSTPLRVDEIVNGQVLALRRLFQVPLAIILGFEALGCAGSFLALAVENKMPLGAILMVGVAGVVIFGMFVLDIRAVVWAGLWFGLTSKKESQAATKTILFVLVAPFLSLPCTFFYFVGIIVFLVWPIFWMTWAKSRVHFKLREFAMRP